MRELRWVRLRVPCYDMSEEGEVFQNGVIPEMLDGTPTLEELEAEINRLKAQA